MFNVEWFIFYCSVFIVYGIVLTEKAELQNNREKAMTNLRCKNSDIITIAGYNS